MAVTTIDNQAVKLYDGTETLFNDRTSDCQWHHDYYQKITCDDITEIVLSSETKTSNIQKDGDMAYNVTGANNGVTVFKLVDTSVNFVTLNVVAGMTVRNTTDNTTATVTIVDATELTLDADIFTATHKDYSVSNYELSGNMTFGTAEMVKTSGAVGAFKQNSILTTDNYYQLQIDITSFASTTPGDQINIKIGGNTVLTIDETNSTTGTMTVYGRSDGAAPTDIEITTDSGISATFSTLRVALLF